MKQIISKVIFTSIVFNAIFSLEWAPLSLAQQTLYPNKLLLNAARIGDAKAVKKAISQGANVNYANANGYTALIIAAWLGHTDI